MESLQSIREEIDMIDNQILALFEQRLALAGKVAKEKQEKKIPVLNSSREKEIILRLTEGKDEETTEYIEKLYFTLFEISRSYQNHLMAENINKS